MERYRQDAFMQFWRMLAAILEFALLAISFFVSQNPQNTDFCMGVLLSALSFAVTKEVDLFSTGELQPTHGNPPWLHRSVRWSMLVQGITIAGTLLLMALLRVWQQETLAFSSFFSAALALVLAYQPALEVRLFLWKINNASWTEIEQASEQSDDVLTPFEEKTPDKRDYEAFCTFWNRVVLKACQTMHNRNEGVCLYSDAKAAVWKRYVNLNKHASRRYMRNPTLRLDRHKVAACYSYAILQACPLMIDESRVPVGSGADYANERLAMLVACTVDSYMLLGALSSLNTILRVDQIDNAKKVLEKGLSFPRHVGHGDYRESVLASLRHTRLEGTYNVLQYAMLIFHWERCTFYDGDYGMRDVHDRILDYYESLSKKHA